MIYYAERNDLLGEDFTVDLDELRKYFFQTYKYFENRGLFKTAYHGVWKYVDFQGESQIHPPTMAPSPEIYFLNHLNGHNIYPIREFYDFYEENELFTVIEILYNHIGDYDFSKSDFVKREFQIEYIELLNNLLKRYKDGYYLDEKYGIIMEQPNHAVQRILDTELPETLHDNVLEQLRTSVKMYYRFDSNMELKKKAINILADILEPLRNELKDILNDVFNINKNNHDKLLFEIVNNFNIRHNDQKQYTEYNKSIWYDWMMQYYLTIIFTYYRLKSLNE